MHGFEVFLEEFTPLIERKALQLNKALWILETTGSGDAADLKAQLDTEYNLLFNDSNIYDKLLKWDKDENIQNPLLKRQCRVLLHQFKQNQIPKELLEEIATKEANLALAYANFRADLGGKKLTENDIKEILKKENEVSLREKAWATSKEVGNILAPRILELVHLRNKAAQSQGFSNYFSMQLHLQEVDENQILQLLVDLEMRSETAYTALIQEVEIKQMDRFKVKQDQLGPHLWSEPFCQEDPLDVSELDGLVKDLDIVKAATTFYQKMGIDITPILARSDMYERPGKCQHAFCIHMDRKGDVRTLNNVKPSIKWLEVVLHELGHAIYELGYDKDLPWLLRAPPHMITTEAMALLAGRQAFRRESLVAWMPNAEPILLKKAEESLKRRQLIFSRWVLVMTHFERALYQNPNQDLNTLWWALVKKYQKISLRKERKNKQDWASKYHIGLAPVYYYSYLFGEFFASEIEEKLKQTLGSTTLATTSAGKFLQEKIFAKGNSFTWDILVQKALGKPLEINSWVSQFA